MHEASTYGSADKDRSFPRSLQDRTGRPGTLIVVGLGIQWGGQTTLAAQRAIVRADRVFFAVSDPWAAHYVRKLNTGAEALPYPRDGRPRRQIYAAMCKMILDAMADGGNVCAVFYGSASVLTRPAHDVVRQARQRGHRARILPGVSSLDCLFADLGFDPGDGGVQCYEAGQFVATGPSPNPSAHLVLFQIAMVGNQQAFSADASDDIRIGLARLKAHLLTVYPAEHQVVIYEASSHPLRPFRAERLPLAALDNTRLSEVSTLYVAPLRHS
jgi:hypothetical protein